ECNTNNSSTVLDVRTLASEHQVVLASENMVAFNGANKQGSSRSSRGCHFSSNQRTSSQGECSGSVRLRYLAVVGMFYSTGSSLKSIICELNGGSPCFLK